MTTESILISSLVVACISFTITVTGIFAPLREWLGDLHEKVDHLVHCPYCFSHYVAAVYLACFDVGLITISRLWIFNYIFSIFALVAISSLAHYVMIRAYEPIAKNTAMRKLERLKRDKAKQN